MIYDKKESARFNKKKVRCYKCLQRGHFARECRAKGGNDKQRYSYSKIQRLEIRRDSKPLITVIHWLIVQIIMFRVMESIASKSFCTAVDAREFASKGPTSESKLTKNSLKTLEKQKRVLQKNQLTLEDKIMVFSIELENKTNLLKHSERINAIVESAKKELQTKLDNHLVQTEKWRTSSKLVSYYDKSSEVNSNDFASSNSSVKTSEPKSNDSTSCASTSSISTSESEAEIESYAGTPIQEPIIVQDLPSFSCNSSDKNQKHF
ncbi:ribonuclease H-like domain-containing protein [Tanacetum coccineum]